MKWCDWCGAHFVAGAHGNLVHPRSDCRRVESARNGAADAFPFDGTDPDTQIAFRQAFIRGYLSASSTGTEPPDIPTTEGERNG